MTYEKDRKIIKDDLLKQLKENGLTRSYYISLVDDYMDLWDVKNELIAQIKEHGVMITYNNGGGQSGRKKNDCVPELTKLNAQMLKLLNELGLRGADIEIEKPEYTL